MPNKRFLIIWKSVNGTDSYRVMWKADTGFLAHYSYEGEWHSTNTSDSTAESIIEWIESGELLKDVLIA